MKKYQVLDCSRCGGHGLINHWGEPDECPDCDGSGKIILYESGTFAKYPGGPLAGRQTKAERNAKTS